MPRTKLEESIAERIPKLGHRARRVAEYIQEHGSITTEQIAALGYPEPRRGAQDVKDAGIVLSRKLVKSPTTGHYIAQYRFATEADIREMRARGRRAFPKPLRDELFKRSGGVCAVCNGIFNYREIQVDHRVPYGVAGDDDEELNPDDFQSLCGSDNRAKSWACEHCENMTTTRDPAICRTCYWGNPDNYQHIALRQLRRTDIVWAGDEVGDFDRLSVKVKLSDKPIPDHIKELVKKHLEAE